MDTSIPDYFISQLLEERAIRNVSDKKKLPKFQISQLIAPNQAVEEEEI